MSQDLRKELLGSNDISRTATEGLQVRSYDGFDGMNYEQFRQPYNAQHKDRNRSYDERTGMNRPDAD